MQFNSGTPDKRHAVPEPASQQQDPDSSPGTNVFEGVPIVSLNPNHSDEEERGISQIFDRKIADMMADSRFADARRLINTMIDSVPGDWRPVQEREDYIVRAFWDEREFFAYQRAHPTPTKPVVWGLPSLSYLLYELGATYSRELRFGHAYTCLANASEYEPDHPGPWLAKGRLLCWEDRFSEALNAFQTAAAIRSCTPPSIVADCIYGQGIALGALRRHTEARDAFARALELDPCHKDAQRNLQGVLHYLRQLPKQEDDAPAADYLR